MNSYDTNGIESAEEKFSPWKFIIIILATFGLIEEAFKAILLWMGLPSLWHVQIHPLWWKALVIFLLWQVKNNFVEWFFHRYMLHSPLVPGFSRLFIQHHRIHHMLTNINPVPTRDSESRKEWKNNYPIDNERKYEASYFPYYTFAGFVLFSLADIILTQVFLPTWPVLMFAVVSIGWSLVMYEFIHAIDHLPMPFWNWIFRIRFLGRLAQRMYAFHETHHEWGSRFRWNQNISGFMCGIPLADWVFGTLKFPKQPFLNGSPVNIDDSEPPIPRFKWIRRLDEIAARKVAQFRLTA